VLVSSEPISPALVERARDVQNRADAKRQVIADQQWKTVQEEDQQNRQLLELSEQILDLTKAVHAYASRASGAGSAAPPVRNGEERP